MCALSVCLFNKITSWKEEKGHEISNLNNLYFQQSHVKRWRCVNLTCQSHIIWHLFFFQFNDDVFLNGYFGAWFHLWFVCLFLPLSIALGKERITIERAKREKNWVYRMENFQKFWVITKNCLRKWQNTLWNFTAWNNI